MTEATAIDTSAVNTAQPTAAAKFGFRFKKDDLGNKRPNVDIEAPVLTKLGIVQMLQSGDEKQFTLLTDAMYDTYRSVIGSWVSDDEKNDAKTFDPAKFTWEAISKMEKEDRRSGAISKEKWAAWAADYLAVMTKKLGKDATQVGNVIQVFLKKFSMLQTQKPMIEKLKVQLGLYLENTENGEEYADILELLNKKADGYLAAGTEELISNLGV